MKIVIELSREDLIAALNAGQPIKGEIVAPKEMLKDSKPLKKKTKAEEETEEFSEEETEDEPVKKKASKEKPAAKTKAKPSAKEEEEAEEEEEESEEETEEEGEEGDDASTEEDEYITGEELVKLKKALNAHKAANGGKPKKTLEILRKFSPGGSEKVKPDVLPKLLKALKV